MIFKSQLEVHLHTRRSVHFHPSDLPDPPFLFFEGLVLRLQISGVWISESLLYGQTNLLKKLDWNENNEPDGASLTVGAWGKLPLLPPSPVGGTAHSSTHLIQHVACI